MITTRLYLDTRATSGNDAEAPLKIQINRRGQTALLSTGVKIAPSQWDAKAQKVTRHPLKNNLNTYLAKLKIQADDLLRDLSISGRAAGMSVTELKNAVREAIDGEPVKSSTFGAYHEAIAATKSPHTAQIWRDNLKMVERFDPGAPGRPLRSFTPEWVQRLDAWFQGNYAPTTRRNAMTILRGLFIKAKKERLVAVNPFDGLKLGYVVTRKRNLSREQLRLLWYAETRTKGERVALDLFRFSFLTIAANPSDIGALTPESIFNGRIEYRRAKTSKPYSVRIVPELEPILAEYSDRGRLFSPFLDHASPRYMITGADKALAGLSERLGLPRVSLYWARHTWATLAAELDIPVDVISSALGHSHGAKVTLVYISIDLKKVDDANRAVIDYALYKE